MTDNNLRRQMDVWKQIQTNIEDLRCREQAQVFMRMGFAADELMAICTLGVHASGQSVLRHTHDPEHPANQHPRPPAR